MPLSQKYVCLCHGAVKTYQHADTKQEKNICVFVKQTNGDNEVKKAMFTLKAKVKVTVSLTVVSLVENACQI